MEFEVTWNAGEKWLVFLRTSCAKLAAYKHRAAVSSEIPESYPCAIQGRSDGGYIGIYTLPKSVPGNYFVH